jgi:hypothetical protein
LLTAKDTARSALLLAIVLAAFTRVALADCGSRADWLNEPTPLREQFTLTSGFLQIEPRSARVVPAGCTEIDTRFAAANTFAQSTNLTHWINLGAYPNESPRDRIRDAATGPVFFTHGETHRLALTIRRGISEKTDVEATIAATHVGGGSGDGVIEFAHRTFHLGRTIRGAFPRNQQLTYLRTNTSETWLDASGYSSGTAILGVTRAFWSSPRSSCSARGLVKIPIVHSPFASKSADFGAELLAMQSIGSSTFHGSLALLRLGPNTDLGTQSRTVMSWTVGADRALTGRTTATLQVISVRSSLSTLGFSEFNRPGYQVGIGIRRLIGDASLLHVTLIENLETFENSTDAGLQIGLSHRF